MLVIESKETGIKARNRIDLYEDKQVEKLCKEVAEKLLLRKDLLEADIYRLTDLLESHIEKTLQQVKEDSNGHPQIILTVKERTELETFGKKPKLVKRLNELLGKTGIVCEERNRILLLLTGITHMMNETLHACIQGSSGSGKTRLLKQIAECMPKDVVRKYTRLSDKALYNFPVNYFSHTVFFLEDAE
jgi:DNA primase